MLTTYPFHVDCVSLSRMTNHQLMQRENQKDVLQVGRSANMLPRRALVMGAIGAGVASESWCLIKHTRVHTGMCYSWKSRPSHLANGLNVLNVLGSKLWIEISCFKTWQLPGSCYWRSGRRGYWKPRTALWPLPWMQCEPAVQMLLVLPSTPVIDRLVAISCSILLHLCQIAPL